MTSLKVIFNTVFAIFGSFLFWFLGDLDGSIKVLVVMVMADYIFGVSAAVVNKGLSSKKGFKGFVKKILMFIIVGIGNILDVHVFGNTGMLREAFILFFIANEGISIVENAHTLGLPIPNKFVSVLEQIKGKSEETKEVDEDGKID